MIFDLETIIAVLLALIVGIVMYYIYNKNTQSKIDKVYQVVETLYNEYSGKIKEDNPQLAEECESALATMKVAMEDGSISALEALEIAKIFIPLMNRLVKFVKEKYTN